MSSLSHLTSCIPTKSNLYLVNSQAAANILSTKSHVPLSLLSSYQSNSPGPRLCPWIFRNRISFYSEELLATRPTPKLEDNSVSSVRGCLFNIFAATLHIGGRSSIRNLRTLHTMMTGTHLSRELQSEIWSSHSGVATDSRFVLWWIVPWVFPDVSRVFMFTVKQSKTFLDYNNTAPHRWYTWTFRFKYILDGISLTSRYRTSKDVQLIMFDS